MFITVMYLQTNTASLPLLTKKNSFGSCCELEKVASKTESRINHQQINGVSHKIYSPKMYEEQPAIIEWLFSYKKTRLLETQPAISKVPLKKPKYERSPFFSFDPKN